MVLTAAFTLPPLPLASPPCPAALGAKEPVWRQPWPSLQLCNKIASSGQLSVAERPPGAGQGGGGGHLGKHLLQ